MKRELYSSTQEYQPAAWPCPEGRAHRGSQRHRPRYSTRRRDLDPASTHALSHGLKHSMHLLQLKRTTSNKVTNSRQERGRVLLVQFSERASNELIPALDNIFGQACTVIRTLTIDTIAAAITTAALRLQVLA